jgi:F-type H+-transporting ATPase subunit b
MRLVLLASDFTSINPGLIFWTIVTFLFVFIVLRWKAWGPVLALVQEREKQIQSAVDSAKHERAEAEKLLVEQKAVIAETRREAAEAMQKSRAEVAQFREELLTKSRKEAEELMATARRQINEEKLKAIAEVKSMSVDLAIEIAAKLIGERLDEPKHRKLAEQFIDQLPKPAESMKRAV